MNDPSNLPWYSPRVNFIRFWAFLAALVLVLVYRSRFYDKHRMLKSGACLIVANHQSHIDPPLIGIAAWPRKLTYIARSGLFKVPGFGFIIKNLNSMPIDQTRGDTAAIKAAIEAINDGNAVLIFPEGSRTPDGAVQDFKRGAAVLLRRAPCPVVPVAVEGCYDAWPRSRPLPHLFGKRVAVQFGDPIDHDDLMKDGPDAALQRLRTEIDRLRLELRGRLRAGSNGRYPRSGPGDKKLSIS